MTAKELLERYAAGERNFSCADLYDATLYDATLRDADLRNADLRNANLRDADLRDADLSGAYLSGANLSRANLRNADLRNVTLRYADLRGADLSDALLPAPTMMLLARWGNVSDRLCGQLMRYDASNCPNGSKLFFVWAKGGTCPYNNLKIQRCAIFEEKRDLWRPGKALSAYRLMVALIREKCRDSDYHKKTK